MRREEGRLAWGLGILRGEDRQPRNFDRHWPAKVQTEACSLSPKDQERVQLNEIIIFVLQANTIGKAVALQCQQRLSGESDLHICKVVMRPPNSRRGEGNVREGQRESLNFHPWQLIMRPPSPLVSETIWGAWASTWQSQGVPSSLLHWAGIRGALAQPSGPSSLSTCKSILAWRIPWTEEPGGLQSMGSKRVRHN